METLGYLKSGLGVSGVKVRRPLRCHNTSANSRLSVNNTRIAIACIINKMPQNTTEKLVWYCAAAMEADQNNTDAAKLAMMPNNNLPGSFKLLRVNKNADIRITLSSAAPVAKLRHMGLATTSPSIGNLGWRSALNKP